MEFRLRHIILIVILMILSHPSNILAQTWEWQNPRPQGNSLSGLAIVNENVGWVVGSQGTILHTTNSGITWGEQSLGTTHYSDVVFKNASTGWIVGSYGTIRRTTNGGASWALQDSNFMSSYADVAFANASHGWAVGSFGPFPLITHTTNGGANWISQASGSNERLFGVAFVDANNGWVAGDGGIILHTTNGGTTWNAQISGTLSSLMDLAFTDVNDGWIVGNGGIILHTTNGGIVWNSQTSGTTDGLNNVAFVDKNNGWVVGNNGTILYTTDSGITWNPQTSGTLNGLYDIAFTNTNNGWVAGAGGIILHTANGGTTWTEQSRGTITSSLRDIAFTNNSLGWAVGSEGIILHTANGGSVWNPQFSGTSSVLYGVAFADANNGWTSGNGGTILHTTNGGTNWDYQASETTSDLYDVALDDASEGWVVGQNGTILHTTDGGITWNPQTSGTVNNLRGIVFLDASNGWIVGNGGIILHTTNGGIVWNSQTSGTTDGLNNVAFVDASNGWAVGSGSMTVSILRTTNGGTTWTSHPSGTINALFSVAFTDPNNGWAVGNSGTIVHTANGGINWTAQTSLTPNTLYTITFNNSINGWMAGYNGMILHYGISIPTITLLAPNGGESLIVDQAFPITWTSTGNIAEVLIHLYRGGTTPQHYYHTIAADEPNNGLFVWNVPAGLQPSTDNYIGIADLDGDPWDFSDEPFNIVASSLQILQPNGGEFYLWNETATINWTTTGSVPSVNLELYSGEPPHGSNIMTITENASNQGNYQWTVPLSVPFGSQYYVHIAGTDGFPADYSDAPFSIGRSCSAILGGSIQYTEGGNVPQANISLSGISGRYVGTYSGGYYHISNIEQGNYSLRINSDGCQPYERSIAIGCNMSQQINITLQRAVDLAIESVKAFQTVRYDQPDPLIADKATVVIATVRNLASNQDVQDIRGELSVIYDGDIHETIQNEVPNPSRHPYGFVVKSEYNVVDSSDWADALYFVVESPPVHNSVLFDVRLRSKYDLPIGDWVESDRSYSFQQSDELNVELVTVQTQDHPIYPIERLNSLKRNIESRLESMLPYGREQLSVCFNGKILNYPSNASNTPGFLQQIMNDLFQWSMWHCGTHFVALFPNTVFPGTPTGRTGYSERYTNWANCSLWGNRIAACDYNSNSDPRVPYIVAHELGHSAAGLGLGDIYNQCGQPDNPCALDVWGLNTERPSPSCLSRGLKPSDINACQDLMSNTDCRRWPKWEPTYRTFKEGSLSRNALVSSSLRVSESGNYCSISGIVKRDSAYAPKFEVEIQNGDYTPIEFDSGAYSIVFYDTNADTVFKTLYFDPVFETRDGLLDYANFFIVTSLPENTGIITLNIGEEYIAFLWQSINSPTVNLIYPDGGETLSDTTVIRWSASDADEYDTLRFDMFADRDNAGWEPLALGLRDTFMVWNTNYFPGTNAVRVKIIASDSWNTASDSSMGTFVVARHEPIVTIEFPQDTTIILNSSYITLLGHAEDLEDGNISHDSLFWYDNAYLLGTGNRVQMSNFTPGLRTITLIATDSDGQNGIAEAYVNILADDDNDNMSDVWEIEHGLDTTVKDGYGDRDLDDLTNLYEYQIGTRPDSADTDHDTFSDGLEISQGSDPRDATSVPEIPPISSPIPITPIGTISYDQQVSFTWIASTATDSLQLLRYEVQYDSDSGFTNPITLFADMDTNATCTYEFVPGLQYYWRVRAFDTYGHWIWSPKTSFNSDYNPIVVTKIDSLAVQVKADGLHFYWSPITQDTSGNPITHIQYVVYVAPNLNQQFLPIAFTSQTEWTDEEVYSLQWNTWFYYVTAMTEGNLPVLISRKNWAKSMTK